MQTPKSMAEIPFLICSLGSISLEGRTTAMKSVPLISLDELTNDVTSSKRYFLNSEDDVFSREFKSLHILICSFLKDLKVLSGQSSIHIPL